MLHESPTASRHGHSGTRRLPEPFEIPVLRRTLERLSGCRTLDGGVCVLCWSDQADAVAPLAESADALVLVKTPRAPVASLDALTAASRWCDGWRGGLRRSGVYDRGFHAHWTLEIADETRADAVVLIDPAAARVDPGFVDALVLHTRQTRDVAGQGLPFAFSPAAPGLGAMVLTLDTLHKLAGERSHPGRLLAYDPLRPSRDVLADTTCLPTPPTLCRTSESFLFDSTRRLNAVFPDAMPRDVIVELTTERACHPVGWAGRHATFHRPTMSVRTFERIAAELAGVDDARITLGGVGDPLLHPDLRDILAIAASHELTLSIDTDLLRFGPDGGATLCDFSVDVVAFSLPAMLPATYAAVMGTPPDGLATVLRNLKSLLECRARAGIAVPLLVPVFTKTRYTTADEMPVDNLGELEAWYDHWSATLDGATIRSTSACGGLVPDATGSDLAPPTRQACRRLGSRLTILSDGTIVSCEEDVLGSQAVGRVDDGTSHPTAIGDTWRTAMASLRSVHDTGGTSLRLFPTCAACVEWHRP